MPKKEPKRSQKEKPESQGISWKAVAAILGGITTFMGGVVTWLDFIVHLQSGYKIFLWAGIAIFIAVWFVILWLLYKQRNYYGYIWFAVTIVAGVSAWYGWTSYVHAREEKLIVLIANFDDTKGDYYALRNEIVEKLAADFAGDDNVSIETVNEIITPGSDSGTPRARELGKSYQADVVIWGWYRPTQNPNITIHIENLSPEQLAALETSTTCEPATTLAALDSFAFQSQLSTETSSLINYLAGLIAFKANNYQVAISRFDKSIANIPTSYLGISKDWSIIYYDRAKSKYFLGQYEQSISDFSQAILLNPENYCAYIDRGASYLNLKEYDLAMQDINKAIDIEPQKITGYLSRGYLYIELKKYELALKDLNTAISINPKDADAYYYRGWAYSESDQYFLALADFNIAVELAPNDTSIYFSRGSTHSKWGKYDQAIADYNKVIHLDPKNVDIYYKRGVIYIKTEQFASAVSDFTRDIELNPNNIIKNTDSYAKRALAYEKIGQYNLAIADYSAAIGIKPNDATLYNYRGLFYGRMGQYDLAIADFTIVIKMDSENADAYKNRGMSYQLLGKTAEAEADFAKYKELTGEDAP